MENAPTLTAIIADDESLARNVIRKYLVGFPQVKIIAECENGLIALQKNNELKPDLIFLDIRMPELDGMSVLNEFTHHPLIIFTTAFHQHAIRAFEINAVDYLLKPFDQERFSRAIMKAIERKNLPGNIQQQILRLQDSFTELLKSERKYISRILIKGKETYSFLQVSDILWFEADSDYVKIHTAEKVYLKNLSLNELEAKLNPEIFVRIHRSTIVNLAFIRELKPYFNGEYYIYLQNGERLKLSRSYKEKIKLIMNP